MNPPPSTFMLVPAPQAPRYESRRWVAVVFVLSFTSLLIANAFGVLPGSSSEMSASFPTAMPQTPASQFLSLSLLSACGRPDSVGAFLQKGMPCEPVMTWSLAEFQAQIAPLGLLVQDEMLVALPLNTDPICPLLVLRDSTWTGNRLCFTLIGSVYRDQGGAHDSAWNWRPNLIGHWTLDNPPDNVISAN